VKFVFIGLYKIKKCHSSTYIVGTLMSCALLNTNIIYLFVLFKHGCYMSIHVVYTWKSCTRFPCLNNAWHLCLNDTNPWNNKFCMDLEQTHEAYKFMMNRSFYSTLELCSIIINLACDELLMKFVQNLFIHMFVQFMHKYHVLKRRLTHINVLMDEVQTYEWMDVTQILHLLINMWFKCVFNTQY